MVGYHAPPVLKFVLKFALKLVLKTGSALSIAYKCHRWVVCRVLILCSLILVAGCAMDGVMESAMDGIGIESAVPDQSSITGSVAAAQQPDTDNETLSDRNIIGDVIAGLRADMSANKPVFWANPATGSQGVINQLVEVQKADGLCREFKTSRQAFNGVSLYQGEACLQKGGDWLVKSFAPL